MTKEVFLALLLQYPLKFKRTKATSQYKGYQITESFATRINLQRLNDTPFDVTDGPLEESLYESHIKRVSACNQVTDCTACTASDATTITCTECVDGKDLFGSGSSTTCESKYASALFIYIEV